MAYDDMKVATFLSQYRGGDVGLWYCSHNYLYELRYTVQFRTPGGFSDASAWCAYDAANESQIVDLMLDAIDIARTPLLERN
jgi:hypothetical protein|nr:MAG TPA: hypothetical protein [Caudoviricetes sp.]